MRWWERSVGYELYIRSFQDTPAGAWADRGAAFQAAFPDEPEAIPAGDGVGDLVGARQRLDYLAWLGVDLLWVTPFYPSPMRDHGYDVSDYRGVDPRFGTLADFDALLSAAHDRGMRVIGDLVPNHTSSDHPWFEQARRSRDSSYRDYYIWRDPAPDGGPPNNWVSHFGGPAWTFDESTGQYWLHLFLPEQPDLNWANPAVADEFDDIVDFWLERGLDGFRIDVAHGLLKHPQLLDNPPRSGQAPLMADVSEFAAFEHRYDMFQPDVVDIYHRWRAIADSHDALLVGEVYELDASRLSHYVDEEKGLHLSFWFRPLHMTWSPEVVRDVLVSAADAVPDRLAWVQASHDRPRPATRFGEGRRGRERALVLATLLFGLPGVPFLYQGEELGLEDGDVPSDAWQDPIALRTGGGSRDGSRTPMPWSSGPAAGFTRAAQSWLPIPSQVPVTQQQADPHAPLHRYRRLVELRRTLPALHGSPVTWLGSDGAVVAYERGDVLVAGNCGDGPAALHVPGAPAAGWRVLFSTRPDGEGQLVHERANLDAREGVVLHRETE